MRSLAATAIGVALLIGCDRPAGSVPPSSGQKTRWEYAQLNFDFTDDSVRFASADEDYSHTNVRGLPDTAHKQLWAELGGKGDSHGIFSELNLIGSRGWELMLYTHDAQGDMYLFKRPVQ